MSSKILIKASLFLLSWFFFINNIFIISTQNALFTVCASGTNSLWITFNLILILDFCQRNFLGLSHAFPVRCILDRFVSGSYWSTHDSSHMFLSTFFLIYRKIWYTIVTSWRLIETQGMLYRPSLKPTIQFGLTILYW